MTRCRHLFHNLYRCVLKHGHRGPHQISTKSGTTVRWFTKTEMRAGRKIRR